jgi:DNA topoisomerase-2
MAIQTSVNDMQLKKNIKDIFHEDVRAFSIYDCQRSIPSGIDGLKPSMRKIVFGMLKKFPHQEVKVSIAASGIQEVSHYHHGSLESTIVGMAQSFPGSNNVPYLEDIGQFGSRINPAASATRYIFTKLSDSFRNLFLKDDDGILKHLDDDGVSIEPEYYIPVIPTVLLNGSDGMGTGFASRILNYNPLDLIDCCLQRVKSGKSKDVLIPWYRGFTGKIERNGSQTIFHGTYSIENTTTIIINELPIGTFTQKYRDVLNDLEDKNIIKSYIDNSTEDKTEFVVTCPRETLRASHDEIMKMFKLISRDTENFTVWNENNKLRKFESANELLDWFVNVRLAAYNARKQYLIQVSENNLYKLKEKARFITFYLQNTKWFADNNKTSIVSRLEEENFINIDDLLNIKVYNLTLDQIADMQQKIKDEEIKLKNLKDTTSENMYLADLLTCKQYFKHLKIFNRP